MSFITTILTALRFRASEPAAEPITGIAYRARFDTERAHRARLDTQVSHRARIDVRRAHVLRVDTR